jgi:hypothetical protein
MTIARSHLGELSVTRRYPCVARRVHPVFMLGEPEGKFDRKEWIGQISGSENYRKSSPEDQDRHRSQRHRRVKPASWGPVVPLVYDISEQTNWPETHPRPEAPGSSFLTTKFASRSPK